ncbi:MAG: LarC family nickel insertion protein [Oscillospiraceae bacterium]|nr:LarC family nickel insertion protein [Oscillospiraceae bacterium]MBQ6404162.1 LarC family nickel insertion protein [Oscillospiraceae bacterium]
MKTLFLDVSTGVAGDMLSAALLELFDNREEIVACLNDIGIPGVVFRADTVKSYEIVGTHMTVTWQGVEEAPGCQHLHHDHAHHHDHRHLFDIQQIVDKLNLPFRVKTHVREVYYLIAEAEAKVHGEPMEHIHFHELGTMDAVADISAACLMIDLLQPDCIVATPICTGFGSIECAHGILPVPAPATAVILEGVPSFAGEIEGELSTPTGTALIRHFAQDYSQQPPMVVDRRGYGIGKKDFGRLSAVRASIGQSV